MAFWKRRSRGSFAPSSQDRVAVNYLGRHPVDDNTSLEHTITPLDTLYRNYKDGKEPAQRVTVEVIVNGLVISMLKGFSPQSESSASSNNRTIMPSAKMYFGATDPARPKIFFVVKRSDDEATTDEKYECHAFLCDTPAIANSLTLQLMETFNHAGDDDTKLAYRKSYAMMQKAQQQSARDKVLLRSQSLNLPRSRVRHEAVSTLKVTMNVDHGVKQNIDSEGNNNSEIARILAKREVDQLQSMTGVVDYTMENCDRSAAVDSSIISPVFPPSATDGNNSDMVSNETHKPIVSFNPKLDSPTKPLRELSTVAEQSPQASPKSSPKQSPKEKSGARKKSENTKENQEISLQKSQEDLSLQKAQEDPGLRRKSVRFADDAEII